MDRRSRAQQWRRARHNYNDLCPPIGRRAATALLWLSCSIALLRALATSNARAQQRAAAQQRRSFLNAHHRSAAQVFPEPPESDHEHEEGDLELSLPECLEYEEEFDYESETETETESESEIESETDFETEPETAPATEPETEPEDERGPVVPKHTTFGQSLTERLHALRLRSPDASPSRAQPSTQEPQNPRQGEEPEPQPEDKDPRDPEESEEPKEKKQQRRCKPKKPTRRDPSPESPSKRGPIPIRRH
ncbi:neuroendocrine secretory protein 55 [Enhydra lutris kenyoni]|uniref:Neuroendocrine secretory protein 55 n=1 Tax=Enhydra lutris kenyoni TaxID=391180 RepID=A0A2Y9IQ63_ENHLU|nr:neuroendocrine secretory protein 55 [Enhydra lutris kenyoni]